MAKVSVQIKKARAQERRALERAMLRQMRKLWIRNDDTALPLQVQATLLGLEIARRTVQ